MHCNSVKREVFLNDDSELHELHLGLNARKPVFGISDKLGSNQPAQLQRQARKLKFCVKQYGFYTCQIGDKKGADQTA